MLPSSNCTTTTTNATGSSKMSPGAGKLGQLKSFFSAEGQAFGVSSSKIELLTKFMILDSLL